MARVCGRPRKEAPETVEPPLTTGQPSSPHKTPSSSWMEGGVSSPNSHNLGVNSQVASLPPPLRQSWAAIMQETPLIDWKNEKAMVTNLNSNRLQQEKEPPSNSSTTMNEKFEQTQGMVSNTVKITFKDIKDESWKDFDVVKVGIG
ncbi:unnamed protein product [Amaranthus hypochondriacus]